MQWDSCGRLHGQRLRPQHLRLKGRIYNPLSGLIYYESFQTTLKMLSSHKLPLLHCYIFKHSHHWPNYKPQISKRHRYPQLKAQKLMDVVTKGVELYEGLNVDFRLNEQITIVKGFLRFCCLIENGLFLIHVIQSNHIYLFNIFGNRNCFYSSKINILFKPFLKVARF